MLAEQEGLRDSIAIEEKYKYRKTVMTKRCM